ncbi:MAG: hypothetical protein IJ017_00645 [Oscillospiraceae bacterium]|nr:hypothetical protein [Oscillospiraceae bacterium]
MKKSYNKPYIAVEFFQLDAAIASACSRNNKIALNFGINRCTLEEEVPELGYFGNACDHNINVPGGDGNDEICYHGPQFADIFMES